MKSFTTWRWNPVRGEYESTPPPIPTGTGEISAIDAFRDCTMMLLGGTGFVGKVLLAVVLDRFPELGHLVIQVRRKKNLSGEQRFYTEVLTSPPLRSSNSRRCAAGSFLPFSRNVSTESRPASVKTLPCTR